MATSRFGKANAFKENMTPMLAGIALLSSCGAWTFGWDNAWWGGILGNVYFNNIFGETAKTTSGVVSYTLSATQQSSGTGMGTGGIMIGCMIAGQVAHWGGRKLCFFAVAIISIIGVLIQVTSGIGAGPGEGRYYQLACGKLIVGISIGIASIAVPLYQAECAPAPIRGALVNFYVTIQALGTFMAYCCLYTVVNAVGQRVWVIPICIQLLAPVMMLVFGWLLPESPRWLVDKGRIDDAKSSLLRLRHGKANYNVLEELAVLQEAKSEAEAEHGSVSWMDCFRGTDLIRTSIVVGIQSLQQGQGISFMSSYLVIFFIQLGLSNVYSLLVGFTALLTVLTMVGFFTQDFIGRRTLLMGGAFFQFATLFVVGALTKAYPTIPNAVANACVAMIFIWLVAFSQSWTNIPWTISAEVPSSRLRDKTLTIGAWSGYGVGLMIGFVNPYLQDAGYGNLGGGVGFVYGAVSFLSIIYVYFMVPELKGIPLEQVDAMFDAGVSIRGMGSHPMRLENKALAEVKAHQSVKVANEKEAVQPEEQHVETV